MYYPEGLVTQNLTGVQMTYIISPSRKGWGYWQEHLERGKIKVEGEDQKFLLSEIMDLNAYEGGLEDICFDLLNPCSSACPAEYFYSALHTGYETVHPLILLAACAAWEGRIPVESMNLASPHLLVDAKGSNYIALLRCRKDVGNVLSMIPADVFVRSPEYFVGISTSSHMYRQHCYAQNSSRICL